MMYDVLTFHARHQPEAPALLDGTNAITFARAQRMVAQLAEALVVAVPDLARLELVGLACADQCWHLLLSFALEALGVATLPFTQPADAGVLQALGQCPLVLAEHHEAGLDRLHRFDLAWLNKIVSAPGGSGFRAASWSSSDLVTMLTTSGSTGQVKAMPLYRHAFDLREHNRVWQYGLSASSCYLVAMPITVSLVSMVARATLRCGGSLCFADPERLIETLALATHVTLLPASARGLLQRLPSSFVATNRLKCCITGAALGAPLRDALIGRLNAEVWDSYGTSETGTLAWIGSNGVADVLADVEVEVVNQHMELLPRGVPGILRARTAEMVDGYLDGAVSSCFVDGWFVTGDRAVAVGARQVRLLGRRDSMLNIGGTKVSPEELEELLSSQGIAADLAVSALADANGIDRLHIGLVSPRSDGELLVERIGAVLGRGFGDVRVIVLDRIPRGDAGKIQRDRLAVELRNAASSSF